IAGTIDERGNRFEGPRKREYPMPPLRWTAFHERMAEAARGLGWHPFPGPALINTQAHGGRGGCVYHGFCNSGGCHVSAKAAPHVTTIRRAIENGRLKVVTRARGIGIDAAVNGRATGVRYVAGTEEFIQPAKVVLLASYTYENPRL